MGGARVLRFFCWENRHERDIEGTLMLFGLLVVFFWGGGGPIKKCCFLEGPVFWSV